MREIKFRAWDKKKKMMETIGLTFARNGELASIKAWHYQDVDGHYRIYLPSEVNLVQYTGLRDKNGKEIYEGDVVKETFPRDKSDPAYDSYGDEGVVEWHEGIGAWSWEHGEEWGMIDSQDVKIIGNIYENPDLLSNAVDLGK